MHLLDLGQIQIVLVKLLRMSKQKFYTPLINKKGREISYKRNEEEDNYTTQPNKSPPYEPTYNMLPPDKIKSNPSFSLDKMSTRTLEIAKTNLIPDSKKRDLFKLPSIKLKNNPEQVTLSQNSIERSKSTFQNFNKTYYIGNLHRCLKKHQTTYLMNLYRQHFYQCIEVLRTSKTFKVPNPKKQLKLPKKNQFKTTVFLDLDETLIHCDEHSSNYTVKLNFPLQKGGSLAAGIRVRPFCKQFLQKLSAIAQIIIFTASSASYADVVLDHLDPDKKWISHRLYRQHCTLEKGYYLKDLRIVNRRLQDVVLVDNSPFCHLLQPENAIPIIPFYHYTRDRELESLLEFLQTVIIETQDTRTAVLNTFFWDKLIQEQGDPRRLFFKYCAKQ